MPNGAPTSFSEGGRGHVLVTGVTGHIGGALVEPLLDAGWDVRVLSRSLEAVSGTEWWRHVDVVEGDAGNADDLDRALRGIDVAYYMIHTMDEDGDFQQRDKHLAESFAAAAEQAGVRRIVYLGWLHPRDEELSEHLASRVQVGQVFVDSPVPAVCLQSAIVLGDGSASFQMLRHLTDRLPAMVAPKWLRNRVQPIGMDDALHYLLAAATLPPQVNRTFDIGGPEVLRYTEMIDRFAKLAGLRRRAVVTLPVLTPRLASAWIDLVTPLPSTMARPLVGTLLHDAVCSENDIAQYIPDPPGGLTGFDAAVRKALASCAPSTGRRNLVHATVATAIAGTAGAIATNPDSEWYRSLDKPAWQPPGPVFPVVWTGLYATIAGTAAATATSFDDDERSGDAAQFWSALYTNLGLNAAWSAFFFRSKKPWWAVAGAAALTVSSADLARRAGHVSDRQRNTLLPYVAWCAFATALSTEIARRNPQAGD